MYRELLFHSLVQAKEEDSEASLILIGNHLQWVSGKQMILRPSYSLWTT